MKNLILIISLVFLCNFTFAQNSDKCSDILKQGLRKTYSIEMDYYSQMSFLLDITSLNYDEFSKKYDFNFDIVYKGIPIKSAMGADKYKQSRNELRKIIKKEELTKYSKSINILSADPDIIYAWKECMNRESASFDLIVSPLDIKKGKYTVSYYLKPLLGYNLQLEGIDYDKEILKVKKRWFKRKVIQGAAKKTIIKLKDPTQKASFLVHTSAKGDFEFTIPGYDSTKFIRPTITNGSLRELENVFMVPVEGFKYREWSHSGCNIWAEERIEITNVDIDKYCTLLKMDVICNRPKSSYSCGGGPWSPVASNSYKGTIYADLTYSNGILEVFNYKITGWEKINFKECDCDNDISNLFNSTFKKIIIDLDFKKIIDSKQVNIAKSKE
ncbi:hypothetical protein EMN47_20145 [Prolixibacteraceae bacterium JC049]|nr:hypothetical protein [Prolixibacteraceae bacterium JC049]